MATPIHRCASLCGLVCDYVLTLGTWPVCCALEIVSSIAATNAAELRAAHAQTWPTNDWPQTAVAKTQCHSKLCSNDLNCCPAQSCQRCRYNLPKCDPHRKRAREPFNVLCVTIGNLGASHRVVQHNELAQTDGCIRWTWARAAEPTLMGVAIAMRLGPDRGHNTSYTMLDPDNHYKQSSDYCDAHMSSTFEE